MFSIKKGAMFGLDARIALAIFGALSVISGAALYSAIQESKTVKEVAVLNELSKAIEEYLLSTGSYLPERSSAMNVIEVGNLFINHANVSGWRGPYFGNASSNSDFIDINLTGSRTVDPYLKTFRQSKDSWGTTITAITPANCTSSNCYIYLSRILDVTTDGGKIIQDLYNRLEEFVDNNDGPGVGKVRGKTSGTLFYFYYELFPEYRKMSN